jgi:hypothetical protein
MFKLFSTLVQFGFVAILFRQTNVIWVFFVTCVGVIDFLHKKQSNPSSSGGNASDALDPKSQIKNRKRLLGLSAPTEGDMCSSEGMLGM